MLTKLLILLKWVVFWWCPSVTDASKAIDEVFTKISLWSSTKGDLWVISHLKTIRLLYTRHLCGDPIHVLPNKIIGIRRDGLPKGLPTLNKIWIDGVIGNKTENIRFVLTVLSISRCIKAWGEPDISSIEKPLNDPIPEDLILRLKNFFYIFHYRNCTNAAPLPLKEIDSKDLYYSQSGGPNGPATWASYLDARAIMIHHPKIGEILRRGSEYLYNLAYGLGGVKLDPSHFTKIRPGSRYDTARKLSVVQDPEGKNRIIAIFDYFSQVYLEGIHQVMFDYLRRIPNDRTFTQDPIVNFPGPYYSLDLSSATDRFPAIIQRMMLDVILGQEKAQIWYDLLVSEPFWAPWLNRFVKYEVGQPMGAYSSWAVFALCHHIIVQYVCWQFNCPQHYILLGDDIVIGGEKLATEYMKIMNQLGVEISPHKSHVSSNTYEFAKRWFHKGREVSPVQVSAFQETWKNYTLCLTTFRSYLSRGFIPANFAPAEEVLYSLFIVMGVFPRKAMNLYHKVKAVNHLYQWIQNGNTEAIRNLIVSRYPNEAPVPYAPDQLEMFINSRLSVTFEKVYSELGAKIGRAIDKVDCKLADLLPTQLPDDVDLTRLLSDDFSGSYGSDLPGPSFVTANPVSLSIRNLFDKLANDNRLVAPARSYKDAVEALVLPDPDRIGPERRKSHMVAQVQAKLAHELIKMCKTLFRDGGPGWMFEAQWLSNHRA
jgi:hypothetical protein